jgi:hypothetical protein
MSRNRQTCTELRKNEEMERKRYFSMTSAQHWNEVKSQNDDQAEQAFVESRYKYINSAKSILKRRKLAREIEKD